MKHLQLQPRLRLLADMVPQGARLADIGTDHGYLPVWLMQQGRIASAIAADIGPEPLAHARRTAEEYGAALDLRLCDGLRGIAAHEADIASFNTKIAQSRQRVSQVSLDRRSEVTRELADVRQKILDIVPVLDVAKQGLARSLIVAPIETTSR